MKTWQKFTVFNVAVLVGIFISISALPPAMVSATTPLSALRLSSTTSTLRAKCLNLRTVNS